MDELWSGDHEVLALVVERFERSGHPLGANDVLCAFAEDRRDAVQQSLRRLAAHGYIDGAKTGGRPGGHGLAVLKRHRRHRASATHRRRLAGQRRGASRPDPRRACRGRRERAGAREANEAAGRAQGGRGHDPRCARGRPRRCDRKNNRRSLTGTCRARHEAGRPESACAPQRRVTPPPAAAGPRSPGAAGKLAATPRARRRPRPPHRAPTGPRVPRTDCGVENAPRALRSSPVSSAADGVDTTASIVPHPPCQRGRWRSARSNQPHAGMTPGHGSAAARAGRVAGCALVKRPRGRAPWVRDRADRRRGARYRR